MGLQKLLWTKKGLFFSDYENDYFFNNNGSTGIVTPNRKTYIQNQVIEQKNGKPLATFDEGFDNVSGKPKIFCRYSTIQMERNRIKSFISPFTQ